MKNILVLIVALLIGVPCLSQDTGPLTKQEIVQLVQTVDQRVAIFERANESAKDFIPNSDFAKGAEAASQAHQSAAVIKKTGPTAYALVTLVLALNQIALSAANDAEAISRRAMSMATSGQTVNMNALAAADSLRAAQASSAEISEQVGHAALFAIKSQAPD
jgi:uncharacterized membrane protein YdfJ with MMPL/SSD domain